jgi:hypothetical protein
MYIVCLYFVCTVFTTVGFGTAKAQSSLADSQQDCSFACSIATAFCIIACVYEHSPLRCLFLELAYNKLADNHSASLRDHSAYMRSQWISSARKAKGESLCLFM